MPRIHNGLDLIDSREVIARIKELEVELEELKALSEAASGSPDWECGRTLVRDSYFKEYARQCAKDIGAIGKSEAWPCNWIDWDKAADQLKQDHSRVDFDGVDYWIGG